MCNLLTGGLTLWGRIRDYVTLGLLGTSILLGGAYYVTSVRLEACEVARVADQDRYEREQAEYEAEALREKQRIEEENRQRAEEADQRNADLASQLNANLVRYRERQSDARVNLPVTSNPAESSDGPSTSPELSTITIPYSDAEICAVNTARLQAVQEWATGLTE